MNKNEKYVWMFDKMNPYMKGFRIFTYDYLVYVSDFCPDFVFNNIIVSQRFYKIFPFYKFYMEKIPWDFLYEYKKELKS